MKIMNGLISLLLWDHKDLRESLVAKDYRESQAHKENQVLRVLLVKMDILQLKE
jgi:hypothetical protein